MNKNKKQKKCNNCKYLKLDYENKKYICEINDTYISDLKACLDHSKK